MLTRRKQVAIVGGIILLVSLCLLLHLPHQLGLPLSLYNNKEPPPRPISFRIPADYNRYVHLYNLSRPRYDGDLQCVAAGVHPHPLLCVYGHGDQLSEQLTHSGLYEPDLTALIQDLLIQHPRIGLLDIGAGVGYFTLLAAAMGHPVLAVEPLPENTRRLGRATRLTGTQSRIMLLQNAVSNRHEMRPLNVQESNIGDSTLEGARVACKKRRGGCPLTKTIYLDDLVPFIPFQRAILKLHVSGYELRALQRASELFDQVDVQYVLINAEMFWRGPGKSLLEFFQSRSYSPFTASIPCVALDATSMGSWPGEVMWVKDKQPKSAVEIM